jgi:serine protease Do
MTGGYQGISFAVPIDTVRNIADQIVESGKIERGYIGVNISPLDEISKKQLGLAADEGVMISKVGKDSPAEKAGMKNGDIVTSVDGRKVGSPEALQGYIGSLKPGRTVSIEVLRKGSRKTLSAKLDLRPGEAVAGKDDDNGKINPSADSFEYQGALFVEAPKNYLAQNGAESGVVVSGVKDDSIFAGILDRGMIVAQINGVEIGSLADLKKFAGDNKSASSFTVQIIMNGFVYYRSIEK